ncbi:arsenate reductase [Sulfurivirga caldicuralii]|uniref:Arsenate reductase n=1 Tax=Sulfurivirga caldicuralii TaxID=364032 RepID=A0A1N6FAF3_9GAMM|nr:arsenate reductase (glutaredoxin) [Sulfurivirga caldicuralii]SIN92265.1 arsenate reductase [Sulfurivirga caldicuralii]
MANKKAIIWHNPRCSKSRGALKLLQEHGVAVEERRYLDNPPSPEELDAVLTMLGMMPEAIVRRKEALFKALHLNESTLTRDAWMEILSRHPKLIERPIVIIDNRAVVARPPKNVLELLD